MVSSVTPFTTMGPSPRVDVLIEAADVADATTITVLQVSAAGEFPVRNAVRRPAAGGFFVTDHEVPLGVPVTYRVQKFNGSGAEIGYVLNLETQVDIPHGKVVLQDPLVPTRAVMVNAEAGFAQSLSYKRDVRVYRAGNDTVALLRQRGLLEDVSLRCWTETAADRDMLESILAETQFLVRTGPEFPVPRILHVVVPQPVRNPIGYAHGETNDVWDLSGSQVSRSELDIIIPVVSYQRFVDAFATYTAFNAAYSTYLDAIANPPVVA